MRRNSSAMRAGVAIRSFMCAPRSENVGGTDTCQGLDRAETTLTRTLELGGDRAARRALAARDADAAQLGGDIRRLDLIADVEMAFVDAQAADAALDIAEQRMTADSNLLSIIRRRVDQGRDPSLIADLASARLAESEIDVDSARRTAFATRERLASYWGGADDFALETDSFGSPSELTAADEDSSPDLALAEADRLTAQARMEVARARAIPDPRLEAGVRQFNQFDDTALIVGVAIPIPIRDNNSSAISRAREDATRAGYEVEARRLGRLELPAPADRRDADITNVQVQINSKAPGYSPLEAEQRVTFPVETAIAGVPGLDYTRSVSRYGLSQVTAVFEDGTDIYFAASS